jgi:hypothetical protein
MGKRIKSEKKGGGKESKFIEEYPPLLIIKINGTNFVGNSVNFVGNMLSNRNFS